MAGIAARLVSGRRVVPDKLVERVGDAAKGKLRRSFQGEALKSHEERGALQRLEEACAALEVDNTTDAKRKAIKRKLVEKTMQRVERKE